MHTSENPAAGTSTQPAASSAESRSRSGARSSNSSRRLSPRRSEPMPNTARRIAVLEPELRRLVDAELASGERVVWLGQPVPKLYRREGWIAVLFGIPFTGFAIFWMAGASGVISDRPRVAEEWFARLFPFFAVPFILVGLRML